MSLVHNNENLIAYIKAKRPGILIETYEESRFIDHIKLIAQTRGVAIHMFSPTFGVKDLMTGDIVESGLFDIPGFMTYLQQKEESSKHGALKTHLQQKGESSKHGALKTTFYIIPDSHFWWNDPLSVRFIREYIEHKQHRSYIPLIFVSPFVSIPPEFEKLLAVDSFSLPKPDDYEMMYDDSVNFLTSKQCETPTPKERETILNALKGLTAQEARYALDKTITKHSKLLVSEIVEEKAQAIKKSGLLEYITNTHPLDTIGGIDRLREWLSRAKATIDPQAAKYLPDPVKGVVLNGFPGSGKSALAKGVAHEWNLPLVRLNMSDVMDAHVGASEKNISRALRLAESISPCILWIDELEKALAGGDSSSSTDSGTTSRVINALLTWLSDRESSVFVLATANSLEGVKDELTRAGRFDDIFFVSVPSQDERAEILDIHLKKREQSLQAHEIEMVANQMTDFTGAEIEQVVKEAMREAYHEMVSVQGEVLPLTPQLLIRTAQDIIPLARRKPQLLSKLRDWAKSSARCVSSDEHNVLHGITQQSMQQGTLDIELA